MIEDTPEKRAEAQSERLGLTRDIVAAYVSANTISADALPSLISSVYETLEGLAEGVNGDMTVQDPAVPIESSVTDDAIICLEDGLPFKSLKRHLRTKYDLTPAAYREKWGLPADYPMVAPNYAKQRSELARQSGLGRRKL